MKKRMCIYFLIFIISVFYLSIPKVVFGQSLAEEVFRGEHNATILDEKIRPLFPDVLRAFGEPEVQSWLKHSSIQTFLNNPGFLRAIDPNIDYRFVGLLTLNDALRKLFADEKFQTLLLPPNQIDELVDLIEQEPLPHNLEIVSENNQSGNPGDELQLRVKVTDQNDQPLGNINVDFELTLGRDKKGSLSNPSGKTNNITGIAETTLTLGEEPGIYKVEASVDGYPLLPQTFTAAAIGGGNGGGDKPRVTTNLEIISGDRQKGETDKRLSQPFVVGVLDQFNKPLPDTSVTFHVMDGGGQLSIINTNDQLSSNNTTATTTTDEYGQASAILRLGPEPGVNRVRASVGGTTPQRTFAAAATTPALPVVYWIENDAIYRFDGRSREKLNIDFQMGWTPTSLAVDMIRGKLYWTERKRGQQKGRIRSANLNGKNPKVLRLGKNNSIEAVLEGIVVDAEKGWLYWTHSHRRNPGKIQSIGVNGKGFQAGLIKDLGSLKHIALGVEWSETPDAIYWTAYDADNESWGIWSSSLSGDIKNKELLKLGGLGELSGLAVAENKLYWAEKTVAGQGRIRCASITGGSVKTLHVLEGSIPSGIAVDAAGSSLYWTSSNSSNESSSTGSIQRLNLDEPIDIVVKDLGNPTGIVLGSAPGLSVPASPAAPPTIVESSDQNALLANYPNPFNPETWIPYQLSEATDVTVSIYSVNGQLVRHLNLGHQTAGVYRSRSRAAYWDGRNAFGERVASGLYFYTLTAGDFTATRKMLIRK